jgi:hypothetical protein
MGEGGHMSLINELMSQTAAASDRRTSVVHREATPHGCIANS